MIFFSIRPHQISKCAAWSESFDCAQRFGRCITLTPVRKTASTCGGVFRKSVSAVRMAVPPDRANSVIQWTSDEPRNPNFSSSTEEISISPRKANALRLAIILGAICSSDRIFKRQVPIRSELRFLCFLLTTYTRPQPVRSCPRLAKV